MQLKILLTEIIFEIFSLAFEHAMAVSSLEFHHRDPFDRILIAQAISESMTIVTKDPNFKPYGASLLW